MYTNTASGPKYAKLTSNTTNNTGLHQSEKTRSVCTVSHAMLHIERYLSKNDITIHAKEQKHTCT